MGQLRMYSVHDCARNHIYGYLSRRKQLHGDASHSEFTTSTESASPSNEIGSKAFPLESDRLALVDLFLKHAKGDRRSSSGVSLDRNGLNLVLKAVGETRDSKTIDKLFKEADVDGNGTVDLKEFLMASDKILGSDMPAGFVLLVGGPGSGKGLVGKRLERACGVVHISCGDLLREEAKRETPLGREIREILARGDLVSSAVLVTLMRRRMRRPENAGKRILLDGFPRSLQNAEDMIELCGIPELALNLTGADDAILIERILARKDRALRHGKSGRDDDNVHSALRRIRNHNKTLGMTLNWLRDHRVPVVDLHLPSTNPEEMQQEPPSEKEIWSQLLAIGRLMRPACAIPAEEPWWKSKDYE